MIRILIAMATMPFACAAPAMETAMPPADMTRDAAGVAGTTVRAPADPAIAAAGRRTLSTAFVRVGPDGHLTVELRNGQTLVLRDVVMRRSDYCGIVVRGPKPGSRRCGGYAEVAAARPGSGAHPGPSQPALPDPRENRALPQG